MSIRFEGSRFSQRKSRVALLSICWHELEAEYFLGGLKKSVKVVVLGEVTEVVLALES